MKSKKYVTYVKKNLVLMMMMTTMMKSDRSLPLQRKI